MKSSSLSERIYASSTKASIPRRESEEKAAVMVREGNYGKLFAAHLLAATSIGIISAAAIHYRRRKSKPLVNGRHFRDVLAPILDRTESGRVGRLERFSDYVARQIGFKDGSECPQLSQLMYEYLKRSKGSEDKIFEYLSNEEDAGSLYVKLVEELERCILSYFAFYWSEASFMITQVLSVESERKKLKDLVMAATRKQRFERISKDLKVTRFFSTLVEELKAIGSAPNGESKCTEVMAPVALSQRSPVLLFMGGGMGAGKSTVLKQILQESFWSEAAANALVVEADAFKETDVLFRALSSKGHHQDMLQTAELVHQSSTDAASSLLVTALNEGRDVIMDGTLSWVPFVEQTIAMARDVHKHRYRMGVGYQVGEDGTITENYWEKIEEEEGEEVKVRKPYRIELVGVVCDAYLAVVRGIRRAIQTGRAVRVKGQLKSHKRFANAFPQYCPLLDSARLYCTNAIAEPPKLIAWKDANSRLLIDPVDFNCLNIVSNLNDEAETIHELYKESDLIFQPGSIWHDVVLQPTRPALQQDLKSAIARIEARTP